MAVMLTTFFTGTLYRITVAATIARNMTIIQRDSMNAASFPVMITIVCVVRDILCHAAGRCTSSIARIIIQQINTAMSSIAALRYCTAAESILRRRSAQAEIFANVDIVIVVFIVEVGVEVIAHRLA